MDLEKAYLLRLEIMAIRTELEDINNLDIFSKHALLDMLQKKLDRYIRELEDIDKYIEAIPDREIRLIARYRYIDGLTWEEIGKRIYMDRTTVARKMLRYNESHIMHK